MFGLSKEEKEKKLKKNEEDSWQVLKKVVDAIFESTKSERDKMQDYLDIYTGKIWDEKKLKKYDSKAFINMIFSTTMSIAPLLTDRNPMIGVISKFAFLSNLAVSWNHALQYFWDISDMQKKVLTWCLDSLIQKVGIAKVYYNKNKGFGGDIQVDIADPKTFFIAPGYDEIWDAPMCGTKTSVPVSKVLKMFPDKEIKSTKELNSKDNKEQTFKYGDSQGNKCDINFVTLYEIWQKDDNSMIDYETEDKEGIKLKEKKLKYPNGKWVYGTDSQYLGEFECPDEHGLPPFVELKDYEIPHNFLGMGEADQIDGLNKELNIQLQAFVDYSRRHNQPNYLCDISQIGDPQIIEDTISEGNKVYKYDGTTNQSGKLPLTPVAEAPLNQVHFELLNMLPRIIEEQTGVTDISKGMAVKKQRQSVPEISMLMENSQTRTRQRIRNLEWSLKRLAYLVLRDMHQYYTEPREINYKQDDNVAYSKIDNTKATAMKTVATPEAIQAGQKAEADGMNPKDQLMPEDSQMYEDYKEFCKAFGDKDDLDPIYFDFQIVIDTNSTLPLDKQSQAQLMMELFKLKAIDRESLLEVLQIPRWKEIATKMNEQEAKQAQPQGAPPGMPMPPPGM